MGAVNKLIEEIAKKQVEEAIVLLEMLSHQIIETSKTAKANQIQFSTPTTSNGEMNKKLAESEAIIKKLQTQYSALQKSYGDLTTKIDKYTTAVEKNTTQKKKLSERDRQYVIDAREVTKTQDNEARVLSGLTTYMQKLVAVRHQYAQTIADYNAKVAMGVKLSNQEQLELYESTVAHKKYDDAIKAGNLSVGKAQEFVGQYERANRGLTNSIAQISRELPSATFGFQTFALGISNNVPIAVDAIQNAVKVNKELIDQGKPTTAVWKQVVGAIFSFNTIMSVGLLLFALFGKEISKFVSSLFGMTKAIDLNKVALQEHMKAVEKFNEKSAEMATSEISHAKKLFETAKNRSVSDKERQKAVDELQRRYPAYLGNLKQEDILTGNISAAELKLINALRLRALAMASQDLLTENLKKQIKAEVAYSQVLNNTADAQGAYDVQQGGAIKTKQKFRLATDEEAESIKNLEKRQKESTETVSNYGKIYQIQQQTNDNVRTNSLIPLKKEEEILELVFQKYAKYLGVVNEDSDAKDKNTKTIKLNTKAREDYLASLYELDRLRLTNVANANKAILDDDTNGYELRTMAAAQYYNNLIDLANMEAKEELRTLEFATDDKNRVIQNDFDNKKAQLDAQLKDEKITREFYGQQLKIYQDDLLYDIDGIIKEHADKQNIIYENQAQKLIEANKATVGQLAKIWDEINFGKADAEIGNVDLTKIQKLGDILKSIGQDATLEEIQGKLQEVAQVSKDNADDINKREAQLALDRAERAKVRLEAEIAFNALAGNLDITKQLDNNKALQDAEQTIIDAKKRVANADNAVTQTQIDNQAKLLEATKKVDEEIYQGKLELYSAIKDLAGQLFDNQINDYDNQIQESNDYYDSLIANAEDGSEQQQRLEEEKAAREEELQKRKVDLQRKQAIFNKLLSVADIGVKLAETIAKIQLEAAVLRANPLTTALSVVALSQIPIAVATSAAQVGIVLATPLPKYEKGRKGGIEEDALINEKRIEPVESTDGSVKLYSGANRIVKLKAGDIVHKSVQEFANSKTAIENAAIMASFANQNDALEHFDYYLGRELNGLSGKMEKAIEKGFKKAKINNYMNLPKNDNEHDRYKNRGNFA